MSDKIPSSINHKVAGSPILFEVSLIVTKKDNLAQLELRRRTSDLGTIRTLIECALKHQPVVVLPCFKNRLMSINSLVKAGILYYDADDGTYYFNI